MRAASFDESKGIWTQTVPQMQYYSVQDVCTILDVGGPAVYQSVSRGTLPGYRVNGVVSIKHEDLVAYIDRRQTGEVIQSGALTIERIEPKDKDGAAAVAMGAESTDGDLEESDLDFLK